MVNDAGIIETCKWRIASHVCGITVQWAPIGRERAKRIAAACGWPRIPRAGYEREFQVARKSYYLKHDGGRFEIRRNPHGDAR